MPFLKCLDITGCQNIAADSIVTSFLTKEILEVLRMSNCFQVDEKSLTSIRKSLSEIKVVDVSDCGQISVEHAGDILHNCKRLDFFSFSPAWGPSDLWADPSKLCMHALHVSCLLHACSACMQQAGNLAHLHACSCMHEKGSICMKANACMQHACIV